MILANLSILLMGIVMWLTGWGGAIITIPSLVYLFSISPLIASAYSLIIVGITALVWIGFRIKSGDIEWRLALVFGIPSVIMTYISRHFIVPHIPEHILTVEKGIWLLIAFSIIMFIAWCHMTCKRKSWAKTENKVTGYKKNIITNTNGLFVWTITGIVGAGGGFLIVPALVKLENISIKKAAATSLVIIAMNSLVGSLGDIGNPNIHINHEFLTQILGISILWLLLGVWLQKHISSEKLSRGFWVFTMLIAILMLTKEIFIH